jgi:hypothetical protein
MGEDSLDTDQAQTGEVDGAPSFECDDTARPPEDGLRRLTMQQYRNTVVDLAAWATGAEPQVMDGVAVALDELPLDHREPMPEDLHGSYRRLDQTLQQAHVDAFYSVGVAVGNLLTGPDQLSRVVGECAVDDDVGNDAACLDDFLLRFGSRALRRPLYDEEFDFYRSVYGDDVAADPAAYADVIAVLLNAPDFVYFVEHGDVEVDGQADVYEVAPHELASRLSYQLWQTAPDERLLDAAAAGDLSDPTLLRAEVTRMLADPRARETFDEFTTDWLKVEDLPPLDRNVGDPVFDAFAGDISPDAALRGAMIDEVLAMVGHYAWDEPAGVGALLQSNGVFTRNEDLARLYGVEPWDGRSEPREFGDQRPGLFTRAAFLSTGTANTRPIMKGVFLRHQVLCDEIPPPPANANAVLPELRDDMTTREVVEELTEAPGSACAGCHATLINPLGFATENFDALGRARTAQTLFDADGDLVGDKSIDTSSVPHVVLGDDTAVEGAEDLMALIAESGKAEACVARNYFRFTFARWEDLDVDGCTLEAMRGQLADDGTLVDLITATVLSPAFKRRAFE